ncbi:MAG TPA: response regulator transcription factor [Spirochaetia bacterium]|nr:response regulator transcription factor [Spirochaetia bacterium]
MNTITVLFVDDNEAFLQSVMRSLPDVPGLDFVPVGYARCGEQAVTMARELNPDLVLMDLAMPGIGGLAATKLIKKASPKIRVVVVSVHTNSEYGIAATSAGADGFLSKSDFLDRLAPLLQSLFIGQTA